ncbi:F0F1 ATP synthase subunit B [Caldibacillus debilis]|uniref:F0F1 ATP synthase subunit B n=1 Tax=Caldibacillus debilis TaxID=301148 RepID=UPI003C6C01EA
MKGVKIRVLTNLAVGAAGFTWLDSLYQLVAFILLMVLLKKYAWAPLMKVMQDRENYIANEIENAEKARKEAEELLEKHRQMVKEARLETQKFIEEAKRQGEIQKENIIEAARLEAERLKEAAKAEIEQEREKAVAALREQVASLSVLIASKVIEKEIDEKDHEALVQEMLKKVGEER